MENHAVDENERAKYLLEATTLKMFAVFFSVMGLLVLVGAAYAWSEWTKAAVSIGAGLALLLVAAISLFASRRIQARLADNNKEISNSR